jgi:hypothetical protein
LSATAHDPEKWKPVFRKIMRDKTGMIRKSGSRFSEKIMRDKTGMIRKSGYRFSEKLMRRRNVRAPIVSA